ncbi:MAG: mechanosensitive ion channel family protein [Clostridiales bacterium]|nr:mechanosensitive ion channel family protein [Clostridiales bacterium]
MFVVGLNVSEAPNLLPSFWQDTFLSRTVLGNAVWNWLIACAIVLAALALRRPVSRLAELIGKKALSRNQETGAAMAAALAPAVRLLVVLIGLSLALQSGLLAYSEKVGLFFQHVIDTLKAVVLCLALAGVGVSLLENSTRKAKADGNKQTVTMHVFYRRAIQVAAIVIGVFIGLRVWGFDISGLLAGLGIGGLALSLAAQDTFSNLLGGLTIMTDHAFSIGDVITTPDVEGIVEDIGFRSTKVRTFTQMQVTVPNSRLSSNTVTNLSRVIKRRIRFSINLEYGTTPDQIRSLIEKLKTRMAAREHLIPENTIIALEKFSASSIDVLFQCFTKTLDFIQYLKEQEDILLEIMEVMEQEKLSFAFSALTVHLNDLSRQREAVEQAQPGVPVKD